MSKENEIPRRNRVDLYTPAELSIHNAIAEVESLEPSEEATAIIVKLLEAKSQLHDLVDKTS
jgi:hypothetical protein